MILDNFDKEDIINCESWKSLCDYEYIGQDNLPTGIIHCDIASITELFEKIQDSGQSYIVVSSRSDFGLHLQKQYPPWSDYHKAVDMFTTAENTGYGYNPITCPPRLNVDRCNKDDKYSVKCYSFTEATFNKIPDNVVHWFLTNNTIVDDKLTTIPFGINGVDGNTESINKIFDYQSEQPDRPNYMYVNFQFYTNERLKLYQTYNSEIDKIGIIERNVQYDKFLDRLASHKFVLCPTGNGIDCFRTLEAIYMGCVPLMEMHHGLTFYYDKLKVPVAYSINLASINKQVLYNTEHALRQKKYNFDGIRLSYWRNIINDCAEILLNNRR